MKNSNLGYSISAFLSAVFGFLVVAAGIYLAVKGQDCRSYNDYACAFGVMFSFIVIPYGLIVLLFVGIASLPFSVARLIGSITSMLTGIANIGLCCILVLTIISGGEVTSIRRDSIVILFFPMGIFLGGLALLSTGLFGYQRAKQTN